MHKCAKCQKEIKSMDELISGCECGSRAFVHMKEEIKCPPSPEKVENITQKVENVKVLDKGIYEIDIDGVLKSPLVIQDELGAYHVRLPSPKKKSA